MNIKKLLILNLPYLLFVYPFDKLSQAIRLAPGADLSAKILSIGEGFTAAFSSLGLSFDPVDLLVGIAGAVILRVAVYLKGKNAKKYRHGIEYGSARWAAEPEGIPRMTERMEDRALRLKTLGNAVCPPQAYPIFRYIAMIKNGTCGDFCPYGKEGDCL